MKTTLKFYVKRLILLICVDKWETNRFYLNNANLLRVGFFALSRIWKRIFHCIKREKSSCNFWVFWIKLASVLTDSNGKQSAKVHLTGNFKLFYLEKFAQIKVHIWEKCIQISCVIRRILKQKSPIKDLRKQTFKW